MPPLGLSAGLRKARELGLRTRSLLFAQPRMINASAHYARRSADGILVLHRGENASTDYYLRPRLEDAAAPVAFADLADDPDASAMLRPGGPEALFVIICRYASAAWLEALERAQPRLSRVAFFMDDDLPAMMRDETLPAAARSKVARHYGEHVERLSALASEVWVSTPALARRYPDARPLVISPAPEADPPEPCGETAPLVVYHGTDVHGAERRFALEVARRVGARRPDVIFEITGDGRIRRAASAMSNVEVVRQLAWPDYLARQAGRRAAVSLAPLFASPVNDARAPVKAFDAARLGAAGIYAAAAPYAGFVRDGEDGLLLPMDPEAWAGAILDLMADPGRRLGLARRARERLVEVRRRGRAFPAPWSA